MTERFDVRVARSKVRAARRSLTTLHALPDAPEDLALQARLGLERAEDEARRLEAQLHLEALAARHRDEELVFEAHALAAQSDVWREARDAPSASPRARLEADMRFQEARDFLSGLGPVPPLPAVPEPTWHSTARDVWTARVDHHPLVREAVRAATFTRWAADHAFAASERVTARAEAPRRAADVSAARDAVERWLDEALERLREWRAAYEVAAAHVRERSGEPPSDCSAAGWRLERLRAQGRALMAAHAYERGAFELTALLPEAPPSA